MFKGADSNIGIFLYDFLVKYCYGIIIICCIRGKMFEYSSIMPINIDRCVLLNFY